MEFKRIEEKINDLEWNDRSDLLTENGKELLTELKQALVLLSVVKSLKENEETLSDLGLTLIKEIEKKVPYIQLPDDEDLYMALHKLKQAITHRL